MKIEVGDIVKQSYAGAYFFGLIIATNEKFVTIWRPELPPAQQIQTWPLHSHYKMELIYESR